MTVICGGRVKEEYEKLGHREQWFRSAGSEEQLIL
jgi:hypothetical protein